MHRGEHADDLVLHAVGVLELVHMDIAEPAAAVIERFPVPFEQGARFVEQVVEVQRVVALQKGAVFAVDGADLADALQRHVLLGVLFGGEPEHARVADVELHVFQEFFVREAAGGKRLFDDRGALRFAVNGKIRGEPALFGKAAQDAHAHAVNGADPHAFAARDHVRKALLHLVRRLVREGDGEDGGGQHALLLHKIGDARGEHPRFAAARARKDEHRPLRVGDGLYLFFVEFA